MKVIKKLSLISLIMVLTSSVSIELRADKFALLLAGSLSACCALDLYAAGHKTYLELSPYRNSKAQDDKQKDHVKQLRQKMNGQKGGCIAMSSISFGCFGLAGLLWYLSK